MTSKQRAYLKSLAMKMDAIIQLGKGGLTPENTKAVDEALAARELIKIVCFRTVWRILRKWHRFLQSAPIPRLYR